jgi:general secretion pathway protein B
VLHLVEMPLSFQKSIPDLVFNSHIYGSEPSSRRVMINNNYLKAGDFFSGIRVERITEEGVVLSKDGRSFRVGIVRDWVSPK